MYTSVVNLFFILQILGWNLSPKVGQPDWYVSWFSSATLDESRYSPLKYVGTDQIGENDKDPWRWLSSGL
jgi:hypothetical protein